MKDWRGTNIRVGDTVVYGQTIQSSSRPAIGTVVELVPPKEGVPSHRAHGQDRVKLSAIITENGHYAASTTHVLARRVTVVRLP